MYQIGELVVYGSEGACRIEAIGAPAVPGLDPSKQYYTLAPVYQNCRVYAPVDTTVFMRPVMSRQQAMELIRKIPEIQAVQQTGHGNWRFRGDCYHAYLDSHESDDLVRLIKVVREKERNALKNGRRISQMDERYCKRAVEMLHGELALALEIPLREVEDFIRRSLEAPEPAEL